MLIRANTSADPQLSCFHLFYDGREQISLKVKHLSVESTRQARRVLLDTLHTWWSWSSSLSFLTFILLIQLLQLSAFAALAVNNQNSCEIFFYNWENWLNVTVRKLHCSPISSVTRFLICCWLWLQNVPFWKSSLLRLAKFLFTQLIKIQRSTKREQLHLNQWVTALKPKINNNNHILKRNNLNVSKRTEKKNTKYRSSWPNSILTPNPLCPLKLRGWNLL